MDRPNTPRTWTSLRFRPSPSASLSARPENAHELPTEKSFVKSDQGHGAIDKSMCRGRIASQWAPVAMRMVSSQGRRMMRGRPPPGRLCYRVLFEESKSCTSGLNPNSPGLA